ncbi:MAG: hypothetical protein A2340_08085 [Lentisphaerae bacterium RIFOXYB12_FULL_60_10]|nr:MAG: hypothetical protein A2340_08085 [Lentisphaerae bacterium RIFOXYB12_FULL_60_10]
MKRGKTSGGGAVSATGCVTDGRLPVLKAAIRILEQEYRIMAATRKQAVREPDSHGLHDFRVAMRRFRAATRFFKKPLADTPAVDIRRRLARCSRALGPFRDAQVWAKWCAESRLGSTAQRRTRLRRILQQARQSVEGKWDELEQLLDAARFARLLADMRRLIRREIPAKHPAFRRERFKDHARRTLWKRYRRLLDRPTPDLSWNPARLHELRKRCKRVRYTAEFSAGVLAPACGDLAGALRTVTSTLGRVHDADLQFERARSDARLVRRIQRCRTQAFEEFLEAWAELRSKSFRRRVRDLCANAKA